MQIYIKDIMQAEVTVVDADSTVEAAETLMLNTNRRCVPVVNQERKCKGIVSYIDILRLKREKANLSRTLVSEMCSRQFISVSPHSSMEDAMELMLDHEIGRAHV